MFGYGTRTLIISNKKINDMMEMIKSLAETGLIITGVCETIKNEAKNKKVDF